jgi:hypothetical protein
VSWYPGKRKGTWSSPVTRVSGYDGCGIVVIYSVVSCKTEGSPERLSCIVLECTIVINPIVNPIPVYGH